MKARTRRWLEEIVVGWNLCPFARKEVVNNRVRYAVSEATSEEQLLEHLLFELQLLEDDPGVETTLLIHPRVLESFSDYNQFLDYADGLLVEMGWEGVYQVASFHPDYRFEGTRPEDQENFTNRSPYPLLHILREDSLSRAIDAYPEPEKIPRRNIDFLRALSAEEIRRAFRL